MPAPAIVAAVTAFLKSPAGKKLIASLAAEAITDIGDIKSKEDSLENMTQEQKLDKIREVMTGSPAEFALRSSASAASNILDTGGNMALTNANRLAAAIMAANRTNSTRQNDLYGPSRKEKASDVWAQEKMRRGETIKNATSGISDTIRDVSGLYGQRQDAVRAMQAQQLLNAPGNFYNYLNSVQRANAATTANKNKGGKK